MKAFAKVKPPQSRFLACEIQDKKKQRRAINTLLRRGYLSYYLNIEDYFKDDNNVIYVYNPKPVSVTPYFYMINKAHIDTKCSIKYYPTVSCFPKLS